MNSSPRASTEATHSPSSPVFLHSLTQRLRKGSSASRASSQSSDAPSHAEIDKAQDARSAKRYLLSIVKDDWKFPLTQSQTEDVKAQREASSYRLREESLSEYESEDRKQWAGHEDNPYRFETPDDVSAMVEKRKARKKRLLEQEMSWNDGLRTWTLRRDAWTGAMLYKPMPRSQTGDLAGKRSSKEHKYRNSSESTGRSSTSNPSWPLPTPQNDVEQLDPTDNMIPPGPPPEQQQQPHPDGPYLPIYPPLLPASNMLRSRIRPTAYPTIYSKVVVLSLAPNVPIPLNHMIGALVDGWKAEGNWPPQQSEQTRGPSARRKQKTTESAFQKWKREQEQKRNAAIQQANDVEWVQEEPERELETKSGVRRSISSAMKKLIGAGSGGHEQSNIDEDLEKIGLTFESESEQQKNVPESLQNGHV